MSGKLLLPFAALLMTVVSGCCCTSGNAKPDAKKCSSSEPPPSSITDVYKFLKQNRTYYLATVDGDQPRVRPFGTALLFEGKLYIQTGRKKNVSKQIGKNGKVELCCYDGSSRWLRLTGTLVDDNRREAKAAMLDAHPGLKKMYSPDDNNTQVLYFKNAEAVFYSFTAPPVTVKF